jgi:hypothetical protein
MKWMSPAWALAAGSLLLPVAWSQEPGTPAKPQFEVASLKPDNGCENSPRRFRELQSVSGAAGDAVR